MQLMTHEDNLNYNFIIGNVLFGLQLVIFRIKTENQLKLYPYIRTTLGILRVGEERVNRSVVELM